jgi:hypothetical protein
MRRTPPIEARHVYSVIAGTAIGIGNSYVSAIGVALYAGAAVIALFCAIYLVVVPLMNDIVEMPRAFADLDRSGECAARMSLHILTPIFVGYLAVTAIMSTNAW